ncbi:MAG: serine/threonine protein kinase, partial [Selenomonadaceae bacterium]|nr:serine/threonine protein kinase [Selenomonadaceae bacterium]
MDANIENYIELSFQKIRKLKENEKGEVWIAADKSDRLVVLKYIALTGLPYRVLKEKTFPLCPRVFHAWEDKEKTIVIEEYVGGETLLDRIARKEYLTEDETKNILLALCDGLFPIHKEGVIHRDIKPSNIILQAGNIIRLIDFDASRIVKEHSGDDTTHLGTKGYAPPEQFGYGQTDERSDIYSIGVTLQKALPENYRGCLTKILEKCTAIDPNKRYQNVTELKRAIIFHDGFQKWGKKLAVATVLVISAIVLNILPTV